MHLCSFTIVMDASPDLKAMPMAEYALSYYSHSVTRQFVVMRVQRLQVLPLLPYADVVHPSALICWWWVILSGTITKKALSVTYIAAVTNQSRDMDVWSHTGQWQAADYGWVLAAGTLHLKEIVCCKWASHSHSCEASEVYRMCQERIPSFKSGFHF